MPAALDRDRIHITIDVLPLSVYERTLYILLSRRSTPPYQGMWALPGRFIGMDESAEPAAERMMNDLLSSADGYLEQLYTFSDLNRDPRGRVISMSYLDILPWKTVQDAVPGGDTGLVCFAASLGEKGLRLKGADGSLLSGNDLAFDHGRIIETGIRRLRGKIDYTEIGFRFLADMNAFPLSELQDVFEAVLGESVDSSNFRRTIINRYEKTGQLRQTELSARRGPGRPAVLYSMAKGYEMND